MAALEVLAAQRKLQNEDCDVRDLPPTPPQLHFHQGSLHRDTEKWKWREEMGLKIGRGVSNEGKS